MGGNCTIDNDKFELIIADIATGQTVVAACKKNGVGPAKFYNWIAQSTELADKYTRASNIGCDVEFSGLTDEVNTDPPPSAIDANGRIDPAWVNLQRLRIDTRKWSLSKRQPKKYGDKLELDNQHSGSINITLNREDADL